MQRQVSRSIPPAAMQASFVALCVSLFAFGHAPCSSGDLMFDGFNEPSGHYRTTRRPVFHQWLEGPADPSVQRHSRPVHTPGHWLHGTGNGPHGPHGQRGAHGPHPGAGGRTPGTSLTFPGWSATNPGPGQPGHVHSPGWSSRNPGPGQSGHVHSPGWKPSRKPLPTTPSTPAMDALDENEIPLSLFAKLNEVDTIEDFFRLVEGGDNRPMESEGDIVNRFGEGDTSVQRKGARSYAKAAHCIPENQTVALRPADADPADIYFPACTRVPRCGGCCQGSIQSCQATEVSTLNVAVMVSNYGGNNKLKNARDVMISVEQHTKCRCQCIIKQKDCSQLQRYIPNECRCECTNQDERAKCREGNDRLWDNSTCACICRTEKLCSTGQFFNPRTCVCERLPERKRSTNHQQTTETQSEEFIWT